MRRVTLAVALILAGGQGLPAQPPAPLTKISVRAMPTEVLTRRLFGDLGRIMLPFFSRGRPGIRPTQALRTLEFITVPHAASPEAGLCESTLVTVTFEPVGPASGADTEVRPARLDGDTRYFVADRRRLRNAAPLDDAERERLEMDCRRIDPRTRNLFSARRSDVARRGLRLLLDLVEAARGRRVGAALDCTRMTPPGAPPFTAEACLQAVARLDPDHLQSVGTCGSDSAFPLLCYRTSVDGITLRFALNQSEAPERVVLAPEIAWADTVVD